MDERWQRLADAVRERRLALGMTQAQAAEAAGAGTSLATWSLIERAQQSEYRERTLVAVERALRWPRGSVEQILGGADPAALAAEARAAELQIAAATARGAGSAHDALAITDHSILGEIIDRLAAVEARVAELERHHRGDGIPLNLTVEEHDQLAGTPTAELGLAADAEGVVTEPGVVAKSRRRNRPSPAAGLDE